MLMLYAYRTPPEIARPPIRMVGLLTTPSEARFCSKSPTASPPCREHPGPWLGLIPALMAGKMTEGTASRAILLHPSRDERLTVRPHKAANFAHYVHPITNAYACHGRALGALQFQLFTPNLPELDSVKAWPQKVMHPHAVGVHRVVLASLMPVSIRRAHTMTELKGRDGWCLAAHLQTPLPIPHTSTPPLLGRR